MSENAPTILPLPLDVAVLIKSSTAITSLPQVVLGLLENALDAGAGNIQISIDVRRGDCKVEDDGDGIRPGEFAADGGLGKRHCTSKHDSQSAAYGRDGAFIASVAALSIVTITSQHSAHPSPSTLILHRSRPAARLIPAPAHQQLFFRDHGTRVVVQDLFGSMPVRVKQRAALFAADQKLENKELEDLKRQITAVVLGWHQPVSITVSEACARKKHLIIRRRNAEGKTSLGDTARRSVESDVGGLAIPIFDLSFVCHTLSQAGYVEPSDWSSWTKVSARASKMTIRGAISLQPAPSKQVQFITLGHRPLFPCNGANILFDDFNRQFALSSFGTEQDSSGVHDSRKIVDKRYKQDGYTNKQLQGAGKGVDRWPMFYIRIELEDGRVTRKLEREDILTKILKVLGAMLHSFLEDNHFRPRANLKRTRGKTPTKIPVSKSPVRPDEFFNSWSRIKVGRPSALVPCPSTEKDLPLESLNRTTPETSLLPSDPLDVTETLEPTHPLITTDAASANTDGQEHAIEWINPVTKLKVLVNSRTGLVLSRQPVLKRLSATQSTLQSSSLSSSERITRKGSSCPTTPQPGTWAGDLLSKWKNPIFPITEQAIPQAPNIGNFELLQGGTHNCTDANIRSAFAKSSSTFSSKLSKAALKHAEVIAQVDKKFLLVIIPSSSSSDSQGSNLLVLIDQHAADERIRVEALLEELTSKPPLPLQKPLIFDLHPREQHLFTKHAAYFSRWGIIIHPTPPSTTPLPPSPFPQKNPPQPHKPTSLKITALPSAIAEKCRIDPKSLLNLLRTEAWKLEDGSTVTSVSATTPPQSLLDMLNSRACRSAIMFNDALTKEECEVLVKRLAGTKFPFQCAHGRPSMVPLVDLGGEEVDDGGWEGDRLGGGGGGDGEGGLRLGLERAGLNRSVEPAKAKETFGVAWRRWGGKVGVS